MNTPFVTGEKGKGSVKSADFIVIADKPFILEYVKDLWKTIKREFLKNAFNPGY